MRLLIWFYLLLGFIPLVGITGVVAFECAAAFQPGRRRPDPLGEFMEIVAICVLAFLVPVAIGVGLWCRSQVVRLILLGTCWWNFFVAQLILAVAVLALLGVDFPEGHSLDERPVVSVLVALACAAFSVWQYRVLTSPKARLEFGGRKLGKGSNDVRGSEEGACHLPKQ